MGLLADLVNRRAEAQHKEEEDRKAALRAHYTSIIHDPNAGDAVREQANEDYLKLLSPEAKKTASAGLDMLGKLKRVFGAGPNKAMTQVPPDTSVVATPSPTPAAAFNAGPPQAAAPPPSAAFNAGPPKIMTDYGVDAGKRAAADAVRLEAARRKDKLDAIDASDAPEEDKNAARRAILGAPKAAAPPKLQRGIVKLKDGTSIAGAWDPTANVYYGSGNEVISPTELEGFETSASKAAPRPGDHVLGEKVLTMIDNGDVLYRPDGKTPITKEYINSLGGGKGEFRYILHADGKQIIDPSSMNQVTTTADGKVNVTSPLTRREDVVGGQDVVGASRVGTASTREAVSIDPVTGQQIAVPLRSTTTPIIPGARSAPVPAPARGPAVPSTGSAPLAPPIAAPGGSRPLAGMRPADYNAAMLKAPAIGDAVIQAFGDDSQPNVKPIFSYGDLTKDKASVDRLGNALRTTFSALEKNSGGGTLHGGVGGLGFSLGKAGDWVQNALGLPAATAAQQAAVLRDAIGSLKTDREREYFNSVMTNFATSIGLRALSGASPTGVTVDSIKDELPLIGINVTDQKSFGDKGQRLFGVIKGALEFNPRLQQIWPKGVLSRLDKIPGELAKYQGGTAPTKTVEKFGPKAAPKTAEEYEAYRKAQGK